LCNWVVINSEDSRSLPCIPTQSSRQQEGEIDEKEEDVEDVLLQADEEAAFDLERLYRLIRPSGAEPEVYIGIDQGNVFSIMATSMGGGDLIPLLK
jgi:hypothetical protein